MMNLIKKIIKIIIPGSLLNYYHNKQLLKRNRIEDHNLKNTFTLIYHLNEWQGNESLSGPGSDISRTESLRQGLEKLFNVYNIKSVLDIPCGDFNWMQIVDLSGIKYIGADIVEELIYKNSEQFKSRYGIHFEVLDLTQSKLPKVDLVLCRDCLVHLSYNNVFKAIAGIKSSNSQYLLTTSFTDREFNHDIKTGGWRVLNLERSPFNFPKPLFVINENCIADNGQYTDKCMCLWEVKNINL